MKRQDILVPEDILGFYSLSPENRQSMTIFENINAAGEYPVPPMLIIQGQELMEAWFSAHSTFYYDPSFDALYATTGCRQFSTLKALS